LGTREGDEVVQIYIRDLVASVSRPLQELAGFERVTLKHGERRRIEFALTRDQLGFYDRDMQWTVEPGEFLLRVGTSSVEGLEARFRVD
jgi:beta-glucosidase